MSDVLAEPHAEDPQIATDRCSLRPPLAGFKRPHGPAPESGWA